jgi:imidazolonepropionase-like amidohydrolase
VPRYLIEKFYFPFFISFPKFKISMKKFIVITGLLCYSLFLFAQSDKAKDTDSATFLLHKFAQNIGKEKYTVSRNDTSVIYNIDFKFIDRGSAVPLKAVFKLNKENEPAALYIKGNTSRFSVINDSIVIHGKTAFIKVDDSVNRRNLTDIDFPIAGYSPGTVQMMLVHYWKKHHQPKSIHILPSGDVQIKRDGNDTLMANNTSIVLERYVISGLIWGNELLWTDANGNLYCLITNDAEGDKLEMMREPYEYLLPELIKRAAAYGMQLFRASAGSGPEQHDIIAVTGGTLIDVVNNTTIPNSVIIVQNGIIQKTGTRTNVDIPKDAFIIHAEGKTILPGLWDMHSHFEQAEWGPAYLAAGVTTVRDCGNEFGYINAIQRSIDNGEGVGPHILKAGIIDGKGPMAIGIIQAANAEDAVREVQQYKENGFVQIKIYSSAKPAIVKAICAEAHRLGLTVTGHIPEGMTLQQGVDSGMDQVNHVQYVYSIMKKNKETHAIDFSDSTSIAALDFIKAHHVVIDPTLGVFELAFRSLKDSITVIEPAFATIPQPLQALFINTGEDSATAKRFKTVMTDFLEIVKRMHDKGITIVAGTDMGFPGYSLDRELELYVQAGFSPMEAIQSATIVPATVMGINKISGSLEAGKRADLIIVDGDPLQNIRKIRNVKTVFKDGKIYDPVTLHHLVGFK